MTDARILYYICAASSRSIWRAPEVTVKKILGQIRKAVEDYGMIAEGDQIAVGVSGGKDSMTLLCGLAKLKEFFPLHFELEAVTMTMGIGNFDTAPIAKLCEKLGVRHTIEETVIGKIIFEERNEKNPCSMCANFRRGALNNAAVRLGCNKLALAHNRDDVVETLLMSMFYEGRIHTFSPVTHFKRKNITMIRPLLYVWEKDIKGFVKSEGLTIVKNDCPANGHTTRQKIKDMLGDMSRENRDLKVNLAGAVIRSGIDGWTLARSGRYGGKNAGKSDGTANPGNEPGMEPGK